MTNSIAILVIGLAALYFANAGYSAYLNHRLQVKIEMLRQQESESQRELMQFTQEQATERAKILASIITKS